MSRYLRASNGCKASYPIILYYFMIASKEFTWTDISVATFLYRRFPSTFFSTMFCNLHYCSISCVSSTATGFRAVWPFWPLRPQTVLFKYKFAVDQSECNRAHANQTTATDLDVMTNIHLLEHGSMLHGSVLNAVPLHSFPPWAPCIITVLSDVLIPPSHVFEHWDHSPYGDQTQSTIDFQQI